MAIHTMKVEDFHSSRASRDLIRVSLLLYIKIERIDWFLYALTLCYIPYSVVIVVMVVSTNWNLND